MFATPEDTALVARMLAGDESAFTHMVDTHHGAMFRLAMVFTKDRGAAEEVTQETWLAVVDGLDRFESRSSLKTWLFNILVNKARTRAKRDARMVATADFSEATIAGQRSVDDSRFDTRNHWSHPPLEWTISPEDHLMTRQLAQVIKDAIEALPANQRVVVTLRDIEGMSARQTCDLLELSDGNHRVLLHRGRAALRLAVESYLTGDEGV